MPPHSPHTPLHSRCSIHAALMQQHSRSSTDAAALTPQHWCSSSHTVTRPHLCGHIYAATFPLQHSRSTYATHSYSSTYAAALTLPHCPHFPLKSTAFFLGKHLIHFLDNKMQDFRDFVLHNCILNFYSEQVYVKPQVSNFKNKEVTSKPQSPNPRKRNEFDMKSKKLKSKQSHLHKNVFLSMAHDVRGLRADDT